MTKQTQKQLMGLSMGIFFLTSSQSEATVRRVIPYPSGCDLSLETECCRTTCTGTSWANANAYKSIQDAIADSIAGDEIWVKTGTYYPDECYETTCTNNSQTETFNISNPAVKLYGGFAGTEGETFEQRNPASNVTILSGNIDGDSAWGPVDSGNSIHVVTYNTAGAQSILDGFTIKYGSANGAGVAQNQGGAIHVRNDAYRCLESNLTINNCVIDSNYGSDHGAINDHGLGTIITNCTFTNNVAGVRGAALLVEHGSTQVTNCVFNGNSVAGVSGCQNPTDRNKDCTAAGAPFACCTGAGAGTCDPGAGGAVWLGREADDSSCTGESDPVLIGCDFINNSAEQGGAIWAQDSSATIENCTFKGNVATGLECSCGTPPSDVPTIEGQGGAIWAARTSGNVDDVNINIKGCVFGNNGSPGTDTDRNTAVNKGGAIFLAGAATGQISATITKGDENLCGFYGGRTTSTRDCFSQADSGGGGAIWVEQAEKLTVDDCWFVANETGMPNDEFSQAGFDPGGAIYAKNTTLQVDDSHLMGNCSRRNSGAVYALNTIAEWNNTIFSGNWVGSGFGAQISTMYIGASATLRNCTFSANYINVSQEHIPHEASATYPEAVFVGNGGTLTGYNTIFWDVEFTGLPAFGGPVSEILLTPSSTLTLTNCNIRGGSSEIAIIPGGQPPSVLLTNCISSDPFFDEDLNLGLDSPCIDAGYTPEIDAILLTDIDGDPRVLEAFGISNEGQSDHCLFVDIGAQEYKSDTGSCCNNGSAVSACATGAICCDYSCTAGECCTNADCGYPELPYYCSTTGTNTCVECLSNGNCGSGRVCCSNACFTGNCCTSANCSSGQVCCNHQCTSGLACCSDRDCKFPKVCCETTSTCLAPAMCGY